MIQRIDTHLTNSGDYITSFELSDEQFKVLQATAKRKISNNLREQINETLNYYIIFYNCDKKGSSLKDQISVLISTKESINCLKDFLIDIKKHAVYRSKIRVEDELFHLQNINSDDDKDWDVRQDEFFSRIPRPIFDTRLEEYKNTKTGDIINFKRLKTDLLFWEASMKKTIENLKEKQKNDKGGQNLDEHLDTLLLSLEGIYNKTKGKTGGKLKFIYQALQFIPDVDIRPDYKEPHYAVETGLKDRVYSAKQRHKKR